jgi:hypothetical protein
VGQRHGGIIRGSDFMMQHEMLAEVFRGQRAANVVERQWWRG